VAKQTTPKQEEKAAKKKTDNLAKAREARAKAAHARKWNELWPIVLKRKDIYGCTCEIKRGMTLKDLNKLGGGCTDNPSRGFHTNGEGRWVCPVLDSLRISLLP
jgi:hypothetical protein